MTGVLSPFIEDSHHTFRKFFLLQIYWSHIRPSMVIAVHGKEITRLANKLCAKWTFVFHKEVRVIDWSSAAWKYPDCRGGSLMRWKKRNLEDLIRKEAD